MTNALAEVQNNTFIEKTDTTLLELIDMHINQLFASNKIREVTYKRNLETKKIITTLSIANKPIQEITITEINKSLTSLTNYADSAI